MVTQRRKGDWLARWIKSPDLMLAAKDPIVTAQLAQFRKLPMPNLKLSDGDVAALIAFIDQESAAVTAEKAAAEMHAKHGHSHAAAAAPAGHDHH